MLHQYLPLRSKLTMTIQEEKGWPEVYQKT